MTIRLLYTKEIIKKMILTLVVALLFQSSQSLATDLPHGDMELVISKGTTIHRIMEIDYRPSTFQAIRSNRLLTIVPAGQLMLRFREHQLKSGRGDRHLVLTEDGIWGYLRDSSGLFVGEGRVWSILQSQELHVAIASDTPLLHKTNADAPLAADFTRGEIYQVASRPDEGDGERFAVVLSPDKIDDIALANNVGREEVPTEWLIDKNHVVEIGIRDLSERDPPHSRRGREWQEFLTSIFWQIPKFSQNTDARFYKPCGSEVTSLSTYNTLEALRIELGVGVDTSINLLSIKAGLEGEFKAEIEKAVRATLTHLPTIQIASHMFFASRGRPQSPPITFGGIEPPNSVGEGERRRSYFVQLFADCEEPAQWHSFRTPSGVLEVALTEAELSEVSVPEPITVEPNSGHVIIECHHDFLILRRYLERKFGYDRVDANFIMTAATRVGDPDKLFLCQDRGPSDQTLTG